MTKDIEYYMSLPYKTVVYKDQVNGRPCFMAEHPELPYCMAQGDTPESAIAELKDARRDFIESLIEDEMPIPEPPFTIGDLNAGKWVEGLSLSSDPRINDAKHSNAAEYAVAV